jgi:hypothetical protein
MAFEVIVRGLRQPKHEGKIISADAPRQALLDALDCMSHDRPEPVIEWAGTDQLAALDVDFHGAKPPEKPYQDVFRLQPQPEYWWTSHGKGLKLIYLAAGPLTAGECAALARMVLRHHKIAASGIEIASRTRHPAYPRGEDRCSEVRPGFTPDLGRAKRILLDQYADGDIDPSEWLEENSFDIGQRYPHNRCLIDPNDTAQGDPVAVLEGGIYCHRCAGKLGDGFRSWGRLIGGEPLPSNLRNAVKNRTHWNHARHFMKDEEGFRALLKLWHLNGGPADDENRKLIDRVFYPPLRVARGAGFWMDADTLTPFGRDGLDLILPQMPATQYVDVAPANGNAPPAARIKQSPLALGEFKSGLDLTERGYPAITPIRGVDLAKLVRPFHDERIYAVVPASPPFKYREPGGIAEAEEYIGRCFPGVNLNLLRLLIAAKGLIQRGDLIDVPQIFVSGQSGAGKSVHVHLAAQLACDIADKLSFSPDVQRFQQSYASASDECGFALFDEASKSGVSGKQLRDYCLMFRKGIKFHRLYCGPTPINNPAVVVMTDPCIPSELQTEEQTARRIAAVDLGAGVNAIEKTDWRTTCGTGSVEQWRAGWNNAGFADAFLSDVIDRYFREPGSTFQKVVADLSFKMMNEMKAEEIDPTFREFYDAIQAMPPEEKPWRGLSNCRVFGRGENSRVAEIYRELTGGDEQAIAAAPWSRITGEPGMTCKVKPHGNKVGVKFAG